MILRERINGTQFNPAFDIVSGLTNLGIGVVVGTFKLTAMRTK